MTRVRVNVTEEFLERAISNPRQGLIELIDNALDADAANVDVRYTRDGLGAITIIEVLDDGDGMSHARAVHAFGNLGDSWKREERRTPGGRRRRGHKGHGRWSAFALGDDVTWVSTTLDARLPTENESREARPSTGPASSAPSATSSAVVRGSREALDEFDIEPTEPSSSRPGTVVTVRNVSLKAQRVEGATSLLTRTYAAALARQPSLNMTVDGVTLDPTTVMRTDERLPVPVETAAENDAETSPETSPETSAKTQAAAQTERAILRFVEWSPEIPKVRPALVLADADGESLYDYTDQLPRGVWPYTAYLHWSGFRRNSALLSSPLMWPDDVRQVVEVAVSVLAERVARSAAASRAATLQNWRDEGSYPYTTTPEGPLEEAERDLFDEVALTAAPSILGNDLQGRRLSLRLIRLALTRDPAHLADVLQQVLTLDSEQLAKLHALLQRTTLPALVQSGQQIVHRLDLLDGLVELTGEPDVAPTVLERKQLHEIVAKEPWIFGEAYSTAVSDRGLTQVLKAHRRLLGEDRLLLDDLADPVAEAPAQVGTSRGRIDLMLSRVSGVSAGRRHHLIVELKRPSVVLGAAEVSQLEQYAFEIRSDSRFHDEAVTWEFLLIGTSLDRFAESKAAEYAAQTDARHRYSITTWDRLIRQRRQEMTFVRDALEVTSTRRSGIDALRVAHPESLPSHLQPATLSASNRSA